MRVYGRWQVRWAPLVALTASWPLMALPAMAAKEGWLLRLEAPLALALGAPQSERFGLGAFPSIALARTLGPRLSLGGALRAGALLDGGAPDRSRADPGLGGWVGGSFVARLRPFADRSAATRTAGAWLELGAGGGLTGERLRPAFEAAVGWEFVTRRASIGPFVRYLQIVEPAGSLEPEDARLALVGVSFSFFDRKPEPLPPPVVVAPSLPSAPPPAADTDGDGIADAQDGCAKEAEDKDGFRDEDGCPDPDNDGDGIADAADKCPLEAEVVNGVEDQDGCADQGVIQLVDDRITLEQRVLFDTNFARVKRAGRSLLGAVVDLWKQHPEWERLQIEGHADERGDAAFNQRLSERRAERVRAALEELGVPAEKLSVQGHGNTRPRVSGRDPESLQQNRRVEIVVIRKKPAEAAGGATLAPPALDNDGTAPRRSP